MSDMRPLLLGGVGGSGTRVIAQMGYLVDSSSHYILGVGVPALGASTIVL